MRSPLELLEDRTLLSALVIEITTLADTVDPNDGVTSLREALLEANQLDDDIEIYLMLEGTYELTRQLIVDGDGNAVLNDSASRGDLDILAGGSVRIVGLGAEETVIDASGLFNEDLGHGDRIFDVHAGAVLEIEGMTLTGGTTPAEPQFPSSEQDGGAIRNRGGSVTVFDSSITGNTAQRNGGGISGFATVVNSTISENSARSGGGMSGGNVIDSVISGNTAEQSGGGILLPNEIANSTISGNSAPLGGGIFVRRSTFAVVTITESEFLDNSATLGGAIAGEMGVQIILTGTTITGNSAGAGGGLFLRFQTVVTITDSTISENLGAGGAILNRRGMVTMSGSVVTGNSAPSDAIGGPGILNVAGTFEISNSLISDNTGGWNGGGIFNEDGATVSLHNSTVSGNTVRADGGGIYNSADSSIVITDSTISDNSADSGGGIFNRDGARLSVWSSTLSGNSAVADGGGIYNRLATIEVTQGTLSHNSTYQNGGGIFNEFGTATVSHSTITANRADANGDEEGTAGGIWIEASLDTQTHLSNTIVAGNFVGTGTTASDIAGPLATASFNLIGDPNSAGGLSHGENGHIVGDGNGNPLEVITVLDTELNDNGEPTLTHALVPGSPAINAGDPDFDPNAFDPPLEFDQRGFQRVVDGWIDIGAYEFGAPPRRPDDLLLFDASTGIWHRGLNDAEQLQQQLGHRWSTAVTWDFHHGDFTGDGLLDVAGRQRETGQWFVFSATENGGFTTTYWGRWKADETAGWTDVLVGDFTGDGRDDIVGRVNNNQSNHGQIWVAESTGERFNNRFYGNWSASTGASTEWTHVVAGDFNGDGKDGIAGMRDSGHWFFAQTNESGRFTTTLVGRWHPDADWRHVMSADFTGDGRSDLVGQTATGQWWIGASQTTSLQTYFAGAWATDLRDVVLGDFDGDGLADIAGWHDDGHWWILRSQGQGERMSNERWGWWGPAQDWTPVVGDFTGNGRDDIAGYEANSGQIWVAVSTGESFENQFFGQWNPLGAVGFAAAGAVGQAS